jgi:hypothetical protein
MSTGAWQEQVDWMRANGVVRAAWSDVGALLSCELAPRDTERMPSAEQQAEAAKLTEIEEQRRIDLLDFGAA